MNGKNAINKNSGTMGGFFMLYRLQPIFEKQNDSECKKFLLAMFDYYRTGKTDFGGNRSLEILFNAMVVKPILDNKEVM